jgi:hypothetical protein
MFVRFKQPKSLQFRSLLNTSILDRRIFRKGTSSMSRLNLRSILLASLVIVVSTSLARAQEWKETKSKEGKFKALFPSAANSGSQDIPTAVGNIKMYTFSAETNGGKIAYLVMYNDYPVGKLEPADQEKLLRDARDGAIAKAQGKMKNDAEIKLGEYPGRGFQFTGKFQDIEVDADWRLYLVGPRLYQLAVIGVGTPVPAESIKKFFNSFALVEE